MSVQDIHVDREPAIAELERTWAYVRGVKGWFTDVNHTVIGKRYIVTAFVFFLLGGIEAMLMRMQLAFPDSHFMNPDRYNQIFTTHGSTMMFLFAVPVMEGFGIYLVPLMLGTGTGSELRHPLGVAIVGGLIVSQMLTLFTTPVIYLYFDRLAVRLTGHRPWNPLAGSAPAE